MSITDNQLKGNWGEQYIASILSSQGCLVRHVSQGQDSGIDLYCEKVEAGKPYLHFWCQVKTKSKWNGKSNSVSFTPKQNHIEYWLKQPAPVLVFLVPDRRDEPIVPFYICSAFPHKYKKSIVKIKTPAELNDFLNTYLRIESFLWDLKNGKVSHLKTASTEYKKSIPKGFALKYENNLQISPLWTLHRLADDFLFDEKMKVNLVDKIELNRDDIQRIKDSAKYIRPLEELVNNIGDRHYHYYETMGMYYELEKKISRAKKYYNHSLNLLESDPNKVWQNDIKRIKEHLIRLNFKNNLKKH